MMRLYRRRDYKRRRIESSTFVPASYRPLFPGCNTVLYRPQEEYNDSSDSQSDSESEFDDPAFWPEMFEDEDSNTNDEVEKDEITAEDEAATDIIVTEEQEVIDDDDNGGVLPSVPGTIKSRGTKSSGSGHPWTTYL